MNLGCVIFHGVALIIQIVIFCIALVQIIVQNYGRPLLAFLMIWCASWAVYEVFMVLHFLGIKKLR